MHPEEEVCVAYVPIGHREHVEAPAMAYLPAEHVWQNESEMAPMALENFPAAQVVQTVDPSAALNVPTPHAIHPSDDELPAELLYVPRSHIVHCEEPVAA